MTPAEETAVRAVLTAALGGPDALPDGDVPTLHLAQALAAQTGGYRADLDSAARVIHTWADQLTDIITYDTYDDPRLIALRDAMLRHAADHTGDRL